MGSDDSLWLWVLSYWLSMGIFATTLRLAYTGFGSALKTIFAEMPISVVIVLILHVLCWAFASHVIRAFWAWGCLLNISHFRKYSRRY